MSDIEEVNEENIDSEILSQEEEADIIDDDED